MKTGFRGAFVISWSQTELDGLSAAPREALMTGAAWVWRGTALRVDGPDNVLRLDRTDGDADIRRRAARSVQRLVGAAVQNNPALVEDEETSPLSDASFVVTDGVQSYTVTLIETGPDTRPLLMFVNEMPPTDTNLWIVHHNIRSQEVALGSDNSGGVICFTPGTWIDTPLGPRKVEDLREGEFVMTRDNGAQEVLWIGSRRMTGARLFVMPHLRPIRISPGALGIERPEKELLVSPEHRLLVRGRAAQALFNTPEVLVSARDLINDTNVRVDLNVREVTYVHLMVNRHQVLWANGVETESFHPANTALSTLSDEDRGRLVAMRPELEHDPHAYGNYARRNLSSSEAAILRHEAA